MLKLPRVLGVKVVAVFSENFPYGLVAERQVRLWVGCGKGARVDHSSNAWLLTVFAFGRHSRLRYAAALCKSEGRLRTTLCPVMLPWKPIWVGIDFGIELGQRTMVNLGGGVIA